MCPLIRAWMHFSLKSNGFGSITERHLRVCHTFEWKFPSRKPFLMQNVIIFQMLLQMRKWPSNCDTKSTLTWTIWMSVPTVTRMHTQTKMTKIQISWPLCVTSRTTLFGFNVAMPVIIIGRQKWCQYAKVMENCWSVSLAIIPMNLYPRWNAFYLPKTVDTMRLPEILIHRTIMHCV